MMPKAMQPLQLICQVTFAMHLVQKSEEDLGKKVTKKRAQKKTVVNERQSKQRGQGEEDLGKKLTKRNAQVKTVMHATPEEDKVATDS